MIKSRNFKKTARRQKIRDSIRKKIAGTAERPRMSLYRSNKEIYVQFVNDDQGHTIVSASSRDQELQNEKGTKTELAKKVGMIAAERAKSAGIESVVFDRGGYLFHGRVKALADGAREGGLKF